MLFKTYQLIAVCLLSLFFAGTAACSSSNQVETATNEASQAMSEQTEKEDAEVKKYILTVSSGKDGKEATANKQTVVQALQDAGAQKIEALEKLPIIMVTGSRQAIDKAVESGLVESVQEDRVRGLY